MLLQEQHTRKYTFTYNGKRPNISLVDRFVLCINTFFVVVDKRDKNSDPDHPLGPPDPHQSQKLGTALHQNE